MNFSQAANNLFITQQVMSSQIRALEEELGLKLFDRSNRKKIRLTRSGEILYRDLDRMMHELSRSLEKARAVSEEEKNKIKIGVQDVDPVVRKFLPHISGLGGNRFDFEYVFEPIGILTNRLKNGKLDMIVCFSTDYEETLRYCVLEESHMVPSIVVSKKHLLSARKKLSLKDIQDETIYSFSTKFAKNAHNQIIRDFMNAGINPKHFVLKDDLKTIEAEVAEGNGIAISFKEMFVNTKVLKFYALSEVNEGQPVDLILMWKDKAFDDVAENYIAAAF